MAQSQSGTLGRAPAFEALLLLRWQAGRIRRLDVASYVAFKITLPANQQGATGRKLAPFEIGSLRLNQLSNGLFELTR
jgi:hypothetical protein